MEWVETTGRTVEEALEQALDELGVDEDDAEYEVVEEPRTGLFGRLRIEARIRARVRPATPRRKEERRSRSRKGAGAGAGTNDGGGARSQGGTATTEAAPPPPSPQAPPPPRPAPVPAPPRPRPAAPDRGNAERGTDVSRIDQDVDVPIAEQGEVAVEFVRGLLERLGTSGSGVTAAPVDEDTVEVRVEGGDLGLLIGHAGATLQSLQELTRTVVYRQTGARSGRVLVDVNGYSQRRRELLDQFARKTAQDVLTSGTPVALEPMTPADRKVIHDAVNTIDGVVTSSQGEDPHRRVVVAPE